MKTIQVIFHGKCNYELYKLHHFPSVETDQVPSKSFLSSALFTSIVNKYCDWHTRLGHPYEMVLNKLAKHTYLKCTINSTSSKCLVCPLAKTH